MEDEVEYINPLLDIDSFHGGGEKRLAPVIIYLLVIGVPCILYTQYLIEAIPLRLFGVLEVLWAIRMGLYILGDEPKRVEQYKRQINDIYSTIKNLLRIKRIHSNGCIEYLNGGIKYLVVVTNGGGIDPIKVSNTVSKFISRVSGTYNIDMLVQNITSTDALADRYSSVQFFGDKESMSDFIDIIDYNISYIKKNSLLTRTVFVISGRKSKHKEIRKAIEGALSSTEAKVFKNAKIADRKLAQEIISRDIDTFINFEKIMSLKFGREKYYGSKVLGYDLDMSSMQKVENIETKERGFIRRELQ